MPPVKEVDDTDGWFQLYWVLAGTIPLVTLTGDTSNVTPLHTTVDIAVTAGVGFTKTVTVNVVPMLQLEVLGVTV